MRNLREAPPGFLMEAEELELRELADILLFAAGYDDEVARAFERAHEILVTMPAGPFDAWIDELAVDLEACAPGPRLPPPPVGLLGFTARS